jgi:hypothetical protein
MAEQLPLDRDDVVTMMVALLDIRAKLSHVIWLLEEDDDEETQEDDA